MAITHKRHLEKTALCRNEETAPGRCKRGARCWFAHSTEELRCPQYARFGECSRGSCSRVHAARAEIVESEALAERRTRRIVSNVDEHRHPVPEGLSAYQLRALADEPGALRGRKPGHVWLPYVRRLRSLKFFVRQCGFGELLTEIATSKSDAKQTRMIQGRSLLLQHYALVATAGKLTVEQALANEEEARLFYSRVLAVEWCQQLSDVRAYDLEYTVIQRAPSHSDLRLWRIDCEGLAEKRPSVLRGDLIGARVVGTSGRKAWSFGYVHFVNLDHVVVHFHEAANISTEKTYHVVFTISDTNVRRQFEAIVAAPLLTRDRIRRAAESALADRPMSLDFDSKALLKRLNPPQQVAVKRMMVTPGDNSVGLLLIHGPPGTGKTTTVVAGVACLAEKQKRVLVCTPSNQSANLVVERLATDWQMKRGELVRVLAQSYDWRKDCSEEAKGFVIPNEELTVGPVDRATVVVTTLMTAGTLWALGAAGFHYLVVEEAGQTTETELLVPLAFASQAIAGHSTMVVLAGDHKQLGPILRSKAAAMFDFNKSTLERLMGLLERLMGLPEAETLSVQLTRNYRAHPSILRLYNTLTYKDTLEAWAPESKTMTLLRRDPAMGEHPLRFLHIEGAEERESDSPSWMNIKEAHAAVEVAAGCLRKGFSFEDIVILSPYAKQCKKISGILHSKFVAQEQPFVCGGYDPDSPPIKVCSVELFQGREAPIIIMSCVRSRQAEMVAAETLMGIGFVKQPQRLNVAISRAICGLFILGNAATLQTDKLWKWLIDLVVVKFRAVYDCTRGVRKSSRMDKGQLEWLTERQSSTQDGGATYETTNRPDSEWGRTQ